MWCPQLLINGKFEDAASGKTFETYDPRTGEPLMTVAEAQAEDVDRAVKAARQVSHHSHHRPCHLCPMPEHGVVTHRQQILVAPPLSQFLSLVDVFKSICW